MGFYDDIVGKRAQASRETTCPYCKKQFTVRGQERTCREEECLEKRDEAKKKYMREHNRHLERKGNHGMPKLRDAKKPGADCRCPVRCGRCCTEIILSLQDGVPCHVLPSTDSETPKEPYCWYLSSTGCKLYRLERPVSCTGFLCNVAMAVIAGELTVQEGRNIVAKERPWQYRKDDRAWCDRVLEIVRQKRVKLRKRREQERGS